MYLRSREHCGPYPLSSTRKAVKYIHPGREPARQASCDGKVIQCTYVRSNYCEWHVQDSLLSTFLKRCAPRNKNENKPTALDKLLDIPPKRKTSIGTRRSETCCQHLIACGLESSEMRISHILGLVPLLSGSSAVTFTSCTAAQISTLEAAIERATNKSYAAIEHLEANPSGSEIQTTWYGAFSTERYNRVLTAFKVRDVFKRL